VADDRELPQARAVGGIDESPRRWLTRSVVVVDGVGSAALAECVCCRANMSRASRSEHCSACVRHQWLYKVAVVAGFCGSLWVGRLAGGVAFDVAPFAGLWVHLLLAFGAATVCPLVFVLAANLARSEPGHGHWGVAVDHMDGGRTTYRRSDYGRALAAQLGNESREIREPRTGWRLIFVFVLVPVLCCVLAWRTFDGRRFVVHVDNGTSDDLRISVMGHGEVATVPGATTVAISLPRTAMTLVATLDDTPVESLSVGGLDEILADRYPGLFPDIEHDTGDVFIWNVLRRRCYEASTKMYGSIGVSGGSTHHSEKAFVSNTDEPFEYAPGSVQSSLPFDARSQLVRVACD
jgi:hypothetical protein